MADIFFTSLGHKERFVTTMQSIGKVYNGKLHEEYASAVYILTSSAGTWKKAESYVDREGIDFEAMLREVDFSGGYGVLIRLAANLFHDRTACSPVDLMRLDDQNFMIALTALQVRRQALPVADFEAEPAYQRAKPAIAAHEQVHPFVEDESKGEIDWKAIEAQAEQDLQAIVSDADAYAFIERYLSKELRASYIAIYRSDRHEMGRSPKEAVERLLSLPPL
jgi:hypothetical protein